MTTNPMDWPVTEPGPIWWRADK